MTDIVKWNSKWSRSELLAFSSNCRQATESSLAQLNSSVNWAMTLTLAVSGFVIQAIVLVDDAYEDVIIFILIGLEILGFALLVNFFSRTAKSYLNVIRFSLVERHALRVACGAVQFGSFKPVLSSFYVDWKSPISARRTIEKVLLEFGFVYWFLINMALTMYLCTLVSYQNSCYGYLMAALSWAIVLVFERWVFSLSAYAGVTQPHFDAIDKS